MYHRRNVPSEETLNDCVVNLSKQPLSKAEEEFQKGLNYNTAENLVTDFCASSEASFKLSKLNEEVQQEIRQCIIPIHKQKRHNSQLSTEEQNALKKLKNRKDKVILPADKGRTTVILDIEDYMKKAEDLLKDNNVYQQLTKNPIQIFDNKIKTTLKRKYNNTQKQKGRQTSTLNDTERLMLQTQAKTGMKKNVAGLYGSVTWCNTKGISSSLHHNFVNS
ncbi:unnamed protein product [Trichobilharzia regenti]|nr:unnamed protein product [Trichobilharzia regenti]